ncbi:TadE/TadG family type IV pilus assembly protein [Microbacterium amylolyticum]|uniref:Flp pilus assembly protein TadG n=1 Tax=Microbacterium amylolyticum TaxID=936337 RepID=A0ABS4ZKJ1_9MICO|nr:TadE/TadG family type IV pilus assembly protein [Microbacterium amylolyticum]MBP2437812.1 Flp pilus assembly protein TadG [Microbacterium amylolyticum]
MNGDAERGSAPVDFILVGVLLTALTLAVLQLGFAAYTHNVVKDAAVEGAHYAALADNTVADGEERTRRIIARSFGEDAVTLVVGSQARRHGVPIVTMVVSARLPVIGNIGIPNGTVVTAHAPAQIPG